ncbi:DUF488 domain-containing protein [Mucilaginibacter panaciglaebae]|uniref:DUF488 domain-containing protein n=1 Tax=Mucilaginibacter panaciglaebae TaxID=502331 RepID=A0ABP7WE81_9SPHI
MLIKTKRIYEPAAKGDGYRILVDRLWPRGLKKENAHIDKWLKSVAPSSALRTWIHGDKGNWDEFELRYLDELKNSEGLQELETLLKEHHTVTFLYAAKDEQQNHALVLKKLVLVLRER